MADPKQITSLQNDRVKTMVRLRAAQERRKLGLTIIEEPLVISRARDAGIAFTEIWYCREQESSATAALRELLTAGNVTDPSSAPPSVFEVPSHVMDKISYREHSEGLLAVASPPVLELADLNLSQDNPPLIVVVENLEKPGNLGAVQRIADGAGADAVLVCGQGTDLYNPNVLRASRGACFHIPCLAASETEIRHFLSRHEVRILATTPLVNCETAETKPTDNKRTDNNWAEADMTGPVAIILGAEHEGLSEPWLTNADLRVALPMMGVGDSLNISTTAAILLYECVRQRTGHGKATR
ncbi:MAG: RNA methyltransferase [Gemmatimonadales bacterium]|nr:RNA methyltransferase [Gemmatimonadales bacterium]